jgi:hypothetical protein
MKYDMIIKCELVRAVKKANFKALIQLSHEEPK